MISRGITLVGFTTMEIIFFPRSGIMIVVGRVSTVFSLYTSRSIPTNGTVIVW